MVLILDGGSFHYAQIWSNFDLLKAIRNIERVVKSKQKFRKRPILHHTCATCFELSSCISIITGQLFFESRIHNSARIRNPEVMVKIFL